jgi:hypothetical protein
MFIIIGVLTEKMFFTGGSGYIGSPCVVELMELAICYFLREVWEDWLLLEVIAFS